ncbi:MAG: PTS sugar transporter subunit IIA [Myxococcota bacterium]
MRITDILDRSLVIPKLEAEDKNETLREFGAKLAQHLNDESLSESAIANALLERERLGSTGVGEGVAIPHTKIPGLAKLTAAFGRSEKGIAFEAIDNQPVKLVFVLLVPENSAGIHLKALARISRMLKDPEFRAQLTDLTSAESLYEAFINEDGRH